MFDGTIKEAPCDLPRPTICEKGRRKCFVHVYTKHMTFKEYKTFSVLIYSYINTSGNWKNSKLCVSHNFEFFQFSRVLI